MEVGIPAATPHTTPTTTAIASVLISLTTTTASVIEKTRPNTTAIDFALTNTPPALDSLHAFQYAQRASLPHVPARERQKDKRQTHGEPLALAAAFLFHPV
jgi:hypothetical protein